MVRYGTLDSSGRPVYAGTTLVVDGVPYANATREMWLAQGKKPFIEATRAPKSSREGFHFERDGWTEQAKAIVPKWKLVADEAPPPRRWSRLSLKTALAAAGTLAAARQFLSGVEVADGYTAWEALTDCDYIEEGYGGPEKWNALLDGAAQALGKTRAEIDAFLDSIPPE